MDLDSSVDTFIDEDIDVDAGQELESDEMCQDAEPQLGSLGPTEDEPNPFKPSNDLISQNNPRRLVRVILVAVVCDKPAAHKIGGFSSHSHTNLCTCCWITQADKDKARAFMKDAFAPRTNEQQREYGECYKNLPNITTRKNFVKQYATRYTQLSRLPYFNLVEQIVIDPMHNLFLGLVKTHFYNIWVQSKILRAGHKLNLLHEMLADVTLVVNYQLT
ncbi:hypothetical protein BDN67DRAFT_992532 [Paxillus ammoniavirescens]|nr:hypothetical protein BDN67DRAFT_992532 [Paxillus ammoniavirescens]